MAYVVRLLIGCRKEDKNHTSRQLLFPIEIKKKEFMLIIHKHLNSLALTFLKIGEIEQEKMLLIILEKIMAKEQKNHFSGYHFSLLIAGFKS